MAGHDDIRARQTIGRGDDVSPYMKEGRDEGIEGAGPRHYSFLIPLQFVDFVLEIVEQFDILLLGVPSHFEGG